MPDHPPTSWYVMERMPLPYDDATTALGTVVPVSSIEATIGGLLVVDSVRHARPGAVGGVDGRLRCGVLPWQSVPVEVAVEPWSRDDSVVALRPAARPPRTGVARYFESSRSVLAVLRDALVASAPRVPEIRPSQIRPSELRPSEIGPPEIGQDALPKAS
jgi:hypothetical protein